MAKRKVKSAAKKAIKKVKVTRVTPEKTVSNVIDIIEAQYNKARDQLLKGIAKLKSDLASAMKDQQVAQKKYLAMAKDFKKKSGKVTQAQWNKTKVAYRKAARGAEKLKRKLMAELDKHHIVETGQKRLQVLKKSISAFEKEWQKQSRASIPQKSPVKKAPVAKRKAVRKKAVRAVKVIQMPVPGM